MSAKVAADISHIIKEICTKEQIFLNINATHTIPNITTTPFIFPASSLFSIQQGMPTLNSMLQSITDPHYLSQRLNAPTDAVTRNLIESINKSKTSINIFRANLNFASLDEKSIFPMLSSIECSNMHENIISERISSAHLLVLNKFDKNNKEYIFPDALYSRTIPTLFYETIVDKFNTPDNKTVLIINDTPDEFSTETEHLIKLLANYGVRCSTCMASNFHNYSENKHGSLYFNNSKVHLVYFNHISKLDTKNIKILKEVEQSDAITCPSLQFHIIDKLWDYKNIESLCKFMPTKTDVFNTTILNSFEGCDLAKKEEPKMKYSYCTKRNIFIGSALKCKVELVQPRIGATSYFVRSGSRVLQEVPLLSLSCNAINDSAKYYSSYIYMN